VTDTERQQEILTPFRGRRDGLSTTIPVVSIVPWRHDLIGPVQEIQTMQSSVRLCLACLVACLSATACFARPLQPDIVYLHRCVGGCSVLAGNDNAATGHSSLVSGNTTLAAFPGTDAIFDPRHR
jgi:hypothetical protein